MNGGTEVALISEILTAMFLIGGAGITLIGSLGLLRLKSFNERTHAPTLGTTLGAACVALASIIHFSTLGSRVVLHELLIIVLITVTTPISLIVLIRAAVFRNASENERTPAEGMKN